MLSVYTMTAGTRPAWLNECVQSVRDAAFEGLTHTIVECKDVSQWTACRLQCLEAADEFLAFVDDDDFVMSDGLRQCLLALEHTGAGIAFTLERDMLANGKALQNSTTAPTILAHAANLPRAIHHLAVMRRSAIDVRQVTAALADLGLTETGAGLDWALKANAAANGGAVHVPVVGYAWRRHETQKHAGAAQMQALARGAPALRSRIRAWFEGKMDTPISVWEPHANRS